MASPRSPSFYNQFFRAIQSCRPTTYRSLRSPPANSTKAKLHEIGRRPQSTYPGRYGPAATEGLPPPPKPSEPLEPKQAESKQKEIPKEAPKETIQAANKEATKEPTKDTDTTAETKEVEQETSSTKAPKVDVKEDATKSTPAKEAETSEPQPHKELDIVLSVPSPSELKGKTSRHPHLEPSPYEHHFDTYSLVQELAEQAFSEQQSITIMKAVRLQLALNLDLAKEGLVSKSDIENESYLFRAACSELRTTLQSGRFAENQRQRTGRAHLQHEFDILNQKVNQDVLNMREELKAMFNDRKMGLQEEKRKIDTKISELNYEITVLLNSEAKSEVEGLRWVLTRRAALAIAAAAFMTLCSLQYYSIKSREAAEVDKRRKAAKKAQDERMQAADAARYTTPSRSSGTQTDTFSEESLG